MSAPKSSSVTKYALTGIGAFAGGYTGFLQNILPLPPAVITPICCMVGCMAGYYVYTMINDLAPSYRTMFMTGLYAAGGAFLAGLLGNYVPVNPKILQSAGGAGGALIGSGLLTGKGIIPSFLSKF